MLVLVRNFSYTPDASFSEVIFLNTSSLLVVVTGLSYTPRASFSEEFFLHS